MDDSNMMDRRMAATDVIQIGDPKKPGRINPMAPANVQTAIIYRSGCENLPILRMASCIVGWD